jgi:hypothetical protein
MLAYLCDLQNSGGVEEVGPGDKYLECHASSFVEATAQE